LVLLASPFERLGYTRSANAQEVTVVILTRKFAEKSHVLSQPQAELWSRLGDQLPDHWVLYGDTAFALRMGHRSSHDFALKSARPFDPEHLRDNVPFLQNAQVLESRWNHLKVAVGGPVPVEMTFDGGQTIAQIHPPERAGNGVAVASLADLAGEKMHRISERVTERDCRDVAALLYEGTTIDELVGFAKAQYGERFDHKETLRNLTAIDRSGIDLDRETQGVLIRESAQGRLPAKTPIHSERITTEPREKTQRVREQQNHERPGLEWER
jgi:hypothetical protein